MTRNHAEEDPMTEQTKKCTGCGVTKALDEFGKEKRGRDGHRSRCKTCKAKYRVANKAKIAAKDAEYRAANRDKIAAQQAAWRAANRARVNGVAAEWRAANPSKVRAIHAAHRAANPHTAWASGYRVRARKFGHTPVVEDFTRDDVIARYGDHCAYCTDGAFEELDHFIPVKDGGTHTLDGVRPSCVTCNRVKNDKPGDEWTAEQERLDNLTPDELEDAIDSEIARWTDAS